MGPGLDHGVFVPFTVMFGDSVDVPVIQVSIDGSLSPEKNWALGKAVAGLRSEGILILSGGLSERGRRGIGLERTSSEMTTFSRPHIPRPVSLVRRYRQRAHTQFSASSRRSRANTTSAFPVLHTSHLGISLTITCISQGLASILSLRSHRTSWIPRGSSP